MVPARRPSAAANRPLPIEFPVNEATAVMPNSASMNISGGPKLRAYLPRMGARISAMIPPSTEPESEEAKEHPSA